MRPDAPKWATFDLLKSLDVIFRGEHHETFQRIAQCLDLELPVVAPPPNQASGGEAEAAGEADNEVGDMQEDSPAQDVLGRWMEKCLDLSDANASSFLATLFASWKAWTEAEKEYAGSVNAFSRALVKRWGVERKNRGEAGIFFTGVRLSDEKPTEPTVPMGKT